MSARLLFLNATDAYSVDVAGEGDPIALAEAPTRAWRDGPAQGLGSVPPRLPRARAGAWRVLAAARDRRLRPAGRARHKAPMPDGPHRPHDIPALKAALPGLALVEDPALVKQCSRDFFRFGPILNRELLDMTALDHVVFTDPERGLRAGAGSRMTAAEADLRIHASTKLVATLGSFLCGGSGGIGSLLWGGMREPGDMQGPAS